MQKVLTIGHSNHSIDAFVDLLKGAGVTAVADVRSQPASRWSPHFNSQPLAGTLKRAGISYVAMGKQLGGRPDRPDLFLGEVANYEAMAKTTQFMEGMTRVMAGAATHTIALMCSEKEPLDCHRCLLVGRRLAEQGIQLEHILADGRRETQSELEDRLLGLVQKIADMFTPRDQMLDFAYRARAAGAAYRKKA